MPTDVAPNDLRNPISLVRSVTETNMIFIKLTAAPNKVMIPINTPTPDTIDNCCFTSLANASLRVIVKLGGSEGRKRRTLRNTLVA